MASLLAALLVKFSYRSHGDLKRRAEDPQRWGNGQARDLLQDRTVRWEMFKEACMAAWAQFFVVTVVTVTSTFLLKDFFLMYTVTVTTTF